MIILMILTGIFIVSAVILTLIRFFSGPTLYDRIAAIDVMTLITLVFIIILSLYYRNSIYMDAAIVYAVLSFIGVVAFARFMEKKNDK
ncbi:MAG: monovalent cation/H+ antiporter complex subunit F [candidate division WOR-3 bacterium]|nr:monovalent cation/H+ antiporter complex subunit F [candidate division WOR-3 bacterium]